MTNLLPKNRYDLSHMENLKKLDDSSLEKIALDLLAWIQDSQWPASEAIREIILLKYDIMKEPILTVLTDED